MYRLTKLTSLQGITTVLMFVMPATTVNVSYNGMHAKYGKTSIRKCLYIFLTVNVTSCMQKFNEIRKEKVWTCDMY
jgi:hypothetical protein